jgi:hypothetical protein
MVERDTPDRAIRAAGTLHDRSPTVGCNRHPRTCGAVRPETAKELVEVVTQERIQQLDHVRREAAAGAEPWATFWRETDGEGRAAGAAGCSVAG